MAGRDNFTEAVIRKAAGRVGYRCSFPGCPNLTVGASMENNSKVSITGVACHICAAAKGGPRYDDRMTPEERKGIDNCIWMCQTHSKLIDTDESKYTVDLLKQWKKDAEEAASKSLANSDFFSEHYKTNGDYFVDIQQLFDDMIFDGRFDDLDTLLKQYNTPLSDWYEEFILRYRIVHDVYCSISSLDDHLAAYCQLPCKAGVDDLAKCFIAFQLKEQLSKIVDYCCSKSIRLFSEMFISGKLEESIIVPIGSEATLQVPEDLNETFSRFIVNYIRIHRTVGVHDPNGHDYPLYDSEFFYHAVVAAYNVAYLTVYGNDCFESIITSPYYLFLIENIERIKLLDLSLQEYIWAGLLSFLEIDFDKFHTIFRQCPQKIRENASIIRAEFMCQIMHDLASVNSDSLLSFSLSNKDYGPMILYLSRLKHEDAVRFLDDHRFLYTESSSFLQEKYELSYKLTPNEGFGFLIQYESLYKEDFTFQCLLARCMSDGDEKDKLSEWIIDHSQTGLNNNNLFLYLELLRENKRWEEIEKLANWHLPNEGLFYIAGCLAESNIDEFMEKSQFIYQSLLDKKWERKSIRFNLGLIQYRFGRAEAAKQYFQEEYDRYQSTDALKRLMEIRYDTNDFTDDSYFENLKHCIDAQSQKFVGAFYLKQRNLVGARVFFLRSLLMNDNDNQSMYGYWQAASSSTLQKAETIKANTAFLLQNSNTTLQVAIHSPEILQDIPTPNQFANCRHFSSEDEKIASFLYCSIGDCVSFENESFVIKSIITVDELINKFFFSSLINQENTITIHGSTGEELIANITPFLKSSKEGLEEIINEYNHQPILFPLSFLASNIGKPMLNTMEFLLFGNKSFIRNNLNSLNDELCDPVFVMSYDSIVILSHLNIDLEALPKDRMVCAQQVKNQILNDINDELSTISDENQKGDMFYSDGKPLFIENTSDLRRNRNAFLLKIKSFVNSLQEAKCSFDYVSDNPEMKRNFNRLFSKKKLYSESGALSLAKVTVNGVLVTDDQFLYAISYTDNIFTIGIIGFLMSIYTNWEKLLNISKKLRDLNFANYLPSSLYKKIVDSLLTDESEVERGSIEIQKWLQSDTEQEPTVNHEDVITALARDVYLSQCQYLNPGNIIEKIIFQIWTRRNPELLVKCITDVFKSELIEFEEQGSSKNDHQDKSIYE